MIAKVYFGADLSRNSPVVPDEKLGSTLNKTQH